MPHQAGCSAHDLEVCLDSGFYCELPEATVGAMGTLLKVVIDNVQQVRSLRFPAKWLSAVCARLVLRLQAKRSSAPQSSEVSGN